ncbi:UNVERIFIED_CONTAM: hypothetical protein HDU68_001820 [Siphonaria sp. JEL0065]|nr:hypothetical protein HDU68_001820 [Siphonaria sp. JEL0065]
MGLLDHTVELTKRVIVYRTGYWYQNSGSIAGLVIGFIVFVAVIAICVSKSQRRPQQQIIAVSQPVVAQSYEQLPLYNASSYGTQQSLGTYGSSSGPTNYPVAYSQPIGVPAGAPERLGVYSQVPQGDPPKTNENYYKY